MLFLLGIVKTPNHSYEKLRDMQLGLRSDKPFCLKKKQAYTCIMNAAFWELLIITHSKKYFTLWSSPQIHTGEQKFHKTKLTFTCNAFWYFLSYFLKNCCGVLLNLLHNLLLKGSWPTYGFKIYCYEGVTIMKIFRAEAPGNRTEES